MGTKGFNKYQPLWFSVAGGKCTINESSPEPFGRTGSVEVYDEENNNWTVVGLVDQPHIPLKISLEQ